MPASSKPSKCFVKGIDHVRFFVGNALQTAEYYCNNFQFQKVCFEGLETGERKRKTIVTRNNDIHFAFTSSLTPSDAEFYSYLQQHGDNSIQDVAFEVTDVQAAYDQAVANGAVSVKPPTKIFHSKLEDCYLEVAVIKPPFAAFVHTLLSRANYNQKQGITESSSSPSSPTPTSPSSLPFLPNYKPVAASSQQSQQTATTSKIQFIDHAAIAIEKDQLLNVIRFYNSTLGFERFLSNDDDDQQTGIAVSSQGSSGLRTMVMSVPEEHISLHDIKNVFKFVFVEPVNEKGSKSQIQEFLDYHSGPGIAHLALLTTDIIHSVDYAKTRGVPIIDVPHTYYKAWKEKAEFSLIDEPWEELEKLGILVDVNAYKHKEGSHNQEQGGASGTSSRYQEYLAKYGEDFKYLLQTFTVPLQDRPTFYLELIDRKGADGFGKGNIKSLFDAIAKLQKERGNLEQAQ